MRRAGVLLLGIAACGRGGFAAEQPAIELPASIDFATVGCTQTRMQTVPMLNQGASTLDFTITSTVDGVTADPASGQLAPGESIDLTVTAVSPAVSAPGTVLRGDLVFETNIPGQEIVLLPVTLQLEGAVIGLEADIVDFGEVTLDQTKREDVVVRNSGNSPTTVSLSASPASRFTIVGDPSAVLNAGDSHAFTLEFAAGSVDMTAYNDAIAIAYDGALCQPPPSEIDVSGYATSSTVLVAPLSFEFGDVTCGSPAVDRSTTISNNSAGSVTYMSTEMGDGDNFFTVSNGNGTIPAGNDATIVVTKSPTPLVVQPGETVANLRVEAVTTKNLPIRQTIRGPVLKTPTTTIEFGTQAPGAVVSRSLTFTNDGNALALVNAIGPTATPTMPLTVFSVSPTAFQIVAGGSKDVIFTITTGSNLGRFTKKFTFSADDQCSASITIDVAVTVDNRPDGAMGSGAGAGFAP
jgi:hypothetical protein